MNLFDFLRFIKKMGSTDTMFAGIIDMKELMMSFRWTFLVQCTSIYYSATDLIKNSL